MKITIQNMRLGVLVISDAGLILTPGAKAEIETPTEQIERLLAAGQLKSIHATQAETISPSAESESIPHSAFAIPHSNVPHSKPADSSLKSKDSRKRGAVLEALQSAETQMQGPE